MAEVWPCVRSGGRPLSLDWKAPPLRRGLPGKERLVNLSFVPWCLFHRLPRPFITLSPVPPSVASHCYANAAAAPCSSPPGLICYVMLMSCHAKCRRRRRGMFRRKQWVRRFFSPKTPIPWRRCLFIFNLAWIQAEENCSVRYVDIFFVIMVHCSKMLIRLRGLCFFPLQNNKASTGDGEIIDNADVSIFDFF